MGYNSSVYVSGEDAIRVLNEMIWNIEQKDCNIALVGCQSGTAPYDTGNIARLNLPQYEFLLATQPDRIILCVNYHDSLDYIRQIISFIECNTGGTVMALVIYCYKVESHQIIIIYPPLYLIIAMYIQSAHFIKPAILMRCWVNTI